MKIGSNGYIIETAGETMLSYYLFNFILYAIALASLVFLLYKLRYKDFPFKMERGKHAE